MIPRSGRNANERPQLRQRTFSKNTRFCQCVQWKVFMSAAIVPKSHRSRDRMSAAPTYFRGHFLRVRLNRTEIRWRHENSIWLRVGLQLPTAGADDFDVERTSEPRARPA